MVEVVEGTQALGAVEVEVQDTLCRSKGLEAVAAGVEDTLCHSTVLEVVAVVVEGSRQSAAEEVEEGHQPVVEVEVGEWLVDSEN